MNILLPQILLLIIRFLYIASIDFKPDQAVIGIDLGNTHSCVSIFQNDRVEIIPNEYGHKITPSIVAFTDEESLVGEAAKNQARLNPSRTIYSVKRLIGRKFDDKEIQHDKKHLSYEIVNKNGKPYIEVVIKGEKKLYSPEEISAMILTKMKKIAEDYLGREVKHAVITVPAYFNDSQRQSTKDAGAIAGLNVLRIINEPTAAATAYELDKKGKEINVIIFNLDSHSFDVSLLNIDTGVFEILALNGDENLGGQDFNNRILNHFLEVIKKNYKHDISTNRQAIYKLSVEIEVGKKVLSSSLEATIEIDNLIEDLNFKETLTRIKFEEINIDLFQKIIVLMDRCLAEGRKNKNEINDVILAGDSVHIPKIQMLIKDYYDGKEPHKSISPEEVVAYGAVLKGGIIGNDLGEFNGLFKIYAAPMSIGIETNGGIMNTIIPRGVILPIKYSKVFNIYTDNQELIINIYIGDRPLTKYNHFLGRLNFIDIPRGKLQIEVIIEIDETNTNIKVTAIEKLTDKAVINNYFDVFSKEIVEENNKGEDDL
jgi:heat shock protein 5